MDNNWSEKYRPGSIAGCILPSRLKVPLAELERTGHLPHLLLVGPPGTGKTTVARILSNNKNVRRFELGAESAREQSKWLSQAMLGTSLAKGPRIVLIDESEALKKPVMTVLRSLLEDPRHKATVIFLTNDIAHFRGALESRCVTFDFTLSGTEQAALLPEMVARCQIIFDENEVTYEHDDLITIVRSSFPDMRKTINRLFAYSLERKSVQKAA